MVPSGTALAAEVVDQLDHILVLVESLVEAY